MPNTGNYHLYVHTSGGSAQKSPVAKNASGTGEGTGSANAGQSYGEKVGKNTEKALEGMVSYNLAASFADQLISYEVSTVELRTGAREYEQQLQFGYGLAKKGVSAAVSLGIGIATGTWPLVVAGLAVSGLKKVVEIGQNVRTLGMQENLEGVSINFANVRAGVSGRRGQNQ